MCLALTSLSKQLHLHRTPPAESAPHLPRLEKGGAGPAAHPHPGAGGVEAQCPGRTREAHMPACAAHPEECEQRGGEHWLNFTPTRSPTVGAVTPDVTVGGMGLSRGSED